MYNTAYKPLQSISKSLVPYIGGICRFWYIPIQDIATWPAVHPKTQMLLGEPVLKADKTWLGPVNVANDELGLVEDKSKDTGGTFYVRKLQGLAQGSDSDADINLGNHDAHQFAVVAEIRCGGYFKFFGSEDAGMDIDYSFASGVGTFDMPGAKFVFADECKHKGLLLPSFAGINSTPPPTGGGSGGGGGGVISVDQNDVEIIPFNTTNIDTVVNIAWNTARKDRFGIFPAIQVWEFDSDNNIHRLLGNALIGCDLAAPNTTSFGIDLTGESEGFIVLK